MQLTYNWNPAIGRAGMIADTNKKKVLSKVAEGAGVTVGLLAAPGTRGESGPPAAAASQYSTSPGQVIALPAGLVADPMVDASWLGIPIYDASREPYSSGDAYAEDDPVPVLREGCIWVVSETAVTENADVYVRISGGTLGAFSAGAAAGKVLFPKGRWRTTTSVAGLAILELAL